MKEYGARSAFMGYRGYPAAICVSVNDEVVHGVPGARRIAIGDVVSIDVGVEVDGFLGDNATTVAVGVTDPRVLALVETARKALRAGLEMAVEGKRLSDVSHAIEETAVCAGFSVVREFVGHGIGRRLHEDPQVPNFGAPGRGPVLKQGMTLAIEPMLSMGESKVRVGKDGWTVTTVDGSYAAHMEHTVAVGKRRADILTPSRVVFRGTEDGTE
jgi:methionyl aminopeptidase